MAATAFVQDLTHSHSSKILLYERGLLAWGYDLKKQATLTCKFRVVFVFCRLCRQKLRGEMPLSNVIINPPLLPLYLISSQCFVSITSPKRGLGGGDVSFFPHRSCRLSPLNQKRPTVPTGRTRWFYYYYYSVVLMLHQQHII